MFCADMLGSAGMSLRRLKGRLSIYRHQEGIQISANDGPTKVILTVPDKGRLTAVAIGGKDTLYAFGGNKIWKRKIQLACSLEWDRSSM